MPDQIPQEAPNLIEADGQASLLMALDFHGFPAHPHIERSKSVDQAPRFEKQEWSAVVTLQRDH